MPLRIYFPFKPFLITQHWGNPNPAYSEQFNDPNFKRHNGIDARPDWYSKTYQVYCPVEGFRVHQVRSVPKGGGNEIWLISKTKLYMGDRDCHALIVLCHADKVLVPAGYEPRVGELIMIGDNTGFSTGPHTHIGLYRVNYDGKRIHWIDDNDATGSVDPAFFFTGIYATDNADASTRLNSALRYLLYSLGLTPKIS